MNRTSAALAALLLTHAVVAGGTGVATAHEGEGILTIESQEVSPEGAASYQVRLTWENDGHAAIDSTVTATPISPDGTQGTPVVLQPVDQDGRYAGSLTFADSGAWTVRLTSVTPAATAEVVEEVAIVAPTTVADPTTSTSTAAESDEARVDDIAAGELDDADDDSGSSTGLIVAVVAVVLISAAVVAGFARSNRRLRDGP